ncbi:MAG TPA: hypothetical protein VF196_02495 [Casimicrobiaceae bacterium]
MRRGLAAGLVAALAVVALVAAVLLARDDEPAASEDRTLSWVGAPQITTPAELPSDRLLSGRLRNASLRTLRLDADRARLVDAAGHQVRGTVRFSAGFVHGLYSPRRAPKEPEPDFERRRLGQLAVMRPREAVPVTLSWRDGPPVRLEVGTVRIELPGEGS